MAIWRASVIESRSASAAEPAIISADVDHLRDVAPLNARGGARFADETFNDFALHGAGATEELDGDLLPERDVRRRDDDAHAPLAKHMLDAVFPLEKGTRNDLSGGGTHGVQGMGRAYTTASVPTTCATRTSDAVATIPAGVLISGGEPTKNGADCPYLYNRSCGPETSV